VRELAARCGSSIGSVQAALVRLEESGAISVTRRGRFGSWLASRADGRLLSTAMQRPLEVALPLPSTLRVQGLASGLRAALVAAGVDARFLFVRGSRQRAAELLDGRCDVAVMSSLAGDVLRESGLAVALELPPGSFVVEHLVYEAARTGPSGRLRVGIDRDSVDFERLTELEFEPDEVQLVPGSYMRSVARMAAGEVDALILDAEEAFARVPAEATGRPLSARTLRAIGTRNTSAAVLVREADAALLLALPAILRDPLVPRVQAEVLAGDRVAEY
jgi:hypothetical protein